MRKFGLIGYPLGHSFSKKYFSEKFAKEKIEGCQYELYEIPQATDLKKILRDNPELEGLNVTIPYKQDVIGMMDDLDEACAEIGAVNCIQIEKNGRLKGYNTDYIGFRDSLINWLGKVPNALVLGTGGASKAVKQAFKDLGVEFLAVSRTAGENVITYTDLEADPSILQKYTLIVNTTPLGTYPKVVGMPDIPIEQLGPDHFIYDLVYNPSETSLMKVGTLRGGSAKNGMEMLVLQAEAAWKLWNS